MRKRVCNVENMTKLYNALLSGNYQQSRYRLRKSISYFSEQRAGFCCLGVACDISGLGQWSEYDEYRIGKDTARHTLPDGVIKWLGLKGEKEFRDGLVFSRGNDLSGVSMNDSGQSFEEIAAMIKKVYLPDDEPEGQTTEAQAEA